jgi:hypothetical protein
LCSELAHPGLLPVVGASKELSNDEDGTIDYLLVSRKCVPLPLALGHTCIRLIRASRTHACTYGHKM